MIVGIIKQLFNLKFTWLSAGFLYLSGFSLLGYSAIMVVIFGFLSWAIKKKRGCKLANTEPKKITLETFKHLPKWAWLFIIACALVPVSTLGGAIPTVVAILGIVLCVRMAATPHIKLPLKLVLCTTISVMAWGFAWLSVFLFRKF